MAGSNNRRNFLKLILAGGAVAGIPATAAGLGASDTDDKVTLLTEDGQLVEISKADLEKFRTGKKAGAEDVHNFIKPSTKQRS